MVPGYLAAVVSIYRAHTYTEINAPREYERNSLANLPLLPLGGFYIRTSAVSFCYKRIFCALADRNIASSISWRLLEYIHCEEIFSKLVRFRIKQICMVDMFTFRLPISFPDI